MQMTAEMMLDPDRLGFDEIKRFFKAFPNEPDYNIAQHGCMLINTIDIRQRMIEAGYNATGRSDVNVWYDVYLPTVGSVARRIVEEGREAWQ